MRRWIFWRICSRARARPPSFWSATTGSTPRTKASKMSRASVRVWPTHPARSMAKRLLDRQISLLDYLTSGAAIFGDKRRAALDPALQGLDVGLLRLEARFSYEKR